MKADFIIRAALQSDAVELKNLFQNTVLAINRRDYSQAEVEDWASCGDDLSNIEDMIKTHYFIVAVNQQSEIVGFSSITPQGYLHSMFVHKDFQGEGIATMLLNEIEQYAITNGIMRITSEVSLTARPFFEKKGYIVEEEQKRKANQLSLCLLYTSRAEPTTVPTPSLTGGLTGLLGSALSPLGLAVVVMLLLKFVFACHAF